jgi:XTP/dITP diphosphohydrolase
VRLIFATSNPGKLRELRRLVEGLPVDVVSPGDLPAGIPAVDEDGATFADNAEKKAVSAAQASGLHALADDSGLCVDALYGLPGVHSARWSEDEAPGLGGLARDEANNRRLLRALQGVPEEIRGAQYRAVLVLASPAGEVLARVEGACRGRIATAPRGEAGFGYDPLFLPDARPGRTMAELPADEKDVLSHRGEAFRALRPEIERLAR